MVRSPVIAELAAATTLAGASEPGRRTLADRIYADLKVEIHSFRLVPGDRFSEVETAQRLGVSRTPLREALLRLRNEGFVDVESKAGWFVRPIDFDHIEDLYDLRVVLELAAVGRLCARQSDPPELEELRRFWLVPESQRETDGQLVGERDERFHGSLVAATGNREMLRVYTDVTERIRIVRRLDFTRPDRIEATYQEHAKILRAIIARKLDTAQLLLRSHIEASKIEVRGITLHALHHARSRSGRSNPVQAKP